MRAGTLDRRIDIKSPVQALDAMGGPVTTWTALASVWADAKDLSGRELIAAQQIEAETTAQFLIRYRADITTEHRITWDGRDYDILSIAEAFGRRDNLRIMAKARPVSAD